MFSKNRFIIISLILKEKVRMKFGKWANGLRRWSKCTTNHSFSNIITFFVLFLQPIGCILSLPSWISRLMRKFKHNSMHIVQRFELNVIFFKKKYIINLEVSTFETCFFYSFL